MQKPEFDPGLTRQFEGPLRRAVNKDGSFNVRRRGAGWRAFHPWLYMVRMGWTAFLALVLAVYTGINLIFAGLYFAMRPDEVLGSESPVSSRFMNDFFFSAHTLTTVGYGSLVPHGLAANLVSSTEALVGLMLFAVITGLLVARASKPSARVGYSPQAVVAPYQNGSALMFRVANERENNNLMEISASVMLMTVVSVKGTLERKFQLLALERDKVTFLPLTWTIVHPIDESSPLWGKTNEEMKDSQAELMILIKAFDDAFGQTVHSRYSYRFDEVVWGAKFRPAFQVDPEGNLLLSLDRLGDLQEASLPTFPAIEGGAN